MSDLRILLKTKSGNETVNISSTSTLAELKAIIHQLTGYPLQNIRILKGFPPCVVDFPDTSTMEQSKIASGDALIVQSEPRTGGNGGQDGDGGSKPLTYENQRGVMMRHEVPSDDSCLFTSVGFLISRVVDVTSSNSMRQLVVNAIKQNPEEYNSGILGKDPDEYCKWILQPNSWGGAIELAILSNHFGIEIAVANALLGTIQRFGEDKKYEKRGFLIFDGIHYDPLYKELVASDDKMRTLFPLSDDDVLLEVEQLMMSVRSANQYTNVDAFSVMCNICDTFFLTKEEMNVHALETGHDRFGEIRT